MSTLTTKILSPQANGLSRLSYHIDHGIRASQDMAIVLVYVHGIERLCATVGHASTGKLLTDFQARLATLDPKKSFVEKLSDRKFVLVFNGLRNRGHVRLAAQKIERLMRETLIRADNRLQTELTMGIVHSPKDGSDTSELLKFAEIAVLDGRRNKETIRFYEPDSADEMILDWNLELRLRAALQAGELEVHYQPKIDLRSGRTVGAEALMRWNEPEIGSISPDIFIEVAESSGQIVDLTDFAVQSVCRQTSEWMAKIGRLNVSINVSSSIILNSEIIDVLKSATSIWGIDPKALTLEVTENALMEDPETSHSVLSRIRELGTRVSIDDFGTGYSSLSYLKVLPADELKIDRRFVMGMLSDPGDYKIVKHTIDIAKSFGLSVVAEGVETAEMLDALKKLGCDYAQGYYICRPVPVDEFEVFVG